MIRPAGRSPTGFAGNRLAEARPGWQNPVVRAASRPPFPGSVAPMLMPVLLAQAAWAVPWPIPIQAVTDPVSAIEAAVHLQPSLDVRRELLAAVVALVVVFAALPRGRRRLASWPLTLLLLAPLPFLVATLFPESHDAPAAALLGARFFLLASLLQAAVLFLAVAVWERLRRPLPRIFLDVLGLELLHTVATESAERVYAAGKAVIRQGESGASMFVVLLGRVEVTASEAGGPPVRLAELAAGEMSLLTGAPRVATVTALEEAHLLEVGKEVFGHPLATRPELVDELGRALQLRMAERARAVAGVAPTGAEAQDIFRTIRDFFSLSR